MSIHVRSQIIDIFESIALGELKLMELIKKTAKFIASVRFAIPILLLFAAVMIVGTFLESAYGTRYVATEVYFTWWFYAIQAGITMSVILAVVYRLPFRKRLTGFYIVHAGIVIIMAGSVVTRVWGIDGLVELNPRKAVSTIDLSEDVLRWKVAGSEFAYELPATSTPMKVDEQLYQMDDLKIVAKSYYPVAAESWVWVEGEKSWISKWLLKNDRVAQSFEVASSVTESIQTSVEMGPLRLEVVQPEYMAAFKKALKAPSKTKNFLVYHRPTGKVTSLVPVEKEVKETGHGGMALQKVVNEKLGMVYYLLHSSAGLFKFFPMFSNLPVNDGLTVMNNSPFELIDIEKSASGNRVLISRDKQGSISMAIGDKDSWSFKEFDGEPVKLPWMGLQLSLLKDWSGKSPKVNYVPVPATKDNTSPVRAVELEVTNKGEVEKYWITNQRANYFSSKGVPVGAMLDKKKIQLPWTLTLEKFKMDKVRGSNSPASYESFVKVSGLEEPAHIYMNNPLKKGGFTFYQSSYFEDDAGEYHSVLSVNKDPGRPWKYMGSIVLVLGFLIHYLIIHGHILAPKRNVVVGRG